MMPEKSKVTALKILVIGKDQVGKTSMIRTYHERSFPGELTAQAADCEHPCEVNGQDFSLSISDSVRGEKDHRIRPLSYEGTDVVLLLFDISFSEEEFRDLRPSWWVELKHYCPTVPVILVATKTDLRDNHDIKTIPTEEGRTMAEQIGAVKYMEISSLSEIGVKELFDEAICFIL